MKYKKTLVAALLILTSCESIVKLVEEGKHAQVTSSDSTIVSSDHTIVSPVNTPRIVLACETAKPNNCKAYADTITKIVRKDLASFSKASDITKFCPKYNKLTDEQKVKAVSEIISGVILYESGYKPTSRMVETTMGIDPVTGMQVASEGLLQLSYQDVKNYKSKGVVCQFDFVKDKTLPLEKRSILDADKNLECGLGIMKYLILKRGSFAFEKNVYWSVLRLGGKYSKVDKIVARTKEKATFCN
jgi:hypothetical protein